jgi:CheY-like chemotaxis protein
MSEWRGVRVPVIAVTGWYPDTDHEDAARALGALAFMCKPLDPAALSELIGSVVKASTAAPPLEPADRQQKQARRTERCVADELDNQASALHCRIANGDMAAREQLAVKLLPRLERQLRARRFGAISDDLVHDAVVDAFVEYITNPVRYDPSKTRLSAYIYLVARRNLMNLRQVERRRMAREAMQVPTEARYPAVLVEPASRTFALSRVRTLLREFTADELRVLRLWLRGERRTETFARALSPSALSFADQRTTVRRIKERVIRRIQRFVTRGK